MKNSNFNRAWESYVSCEIWRNKVARNVFLIEGEEGSAAAITNFSVRQRSPCETILRASSWSYVPTDLMLDGISF